MPAKNTNINLRLSESEKKVFQKTAESMPYAEGNISNMIRLLVREKAAELGIEPETTVKKTD